MGSKPSNIFQMDRPESGGADRDEERESPELLDRAKQELAASEQAKRAGRVREPGEEPGEGARRAQGQMKPPARGRKKRR